MNISLAVKQPPGQSENVGFLAAEVRRLADENGAAAVGTFSWRGAVPTDSTSRKISVERPGIYEISVYLPHGEVVTEVHGVAQGEDVSLKFAPRWLMGLPSTDDASEGSPIEVVAASRLTTSKERGYSKAFTRLMLGAKPALKIVGHIFGSVHTTVGSGSGTSSAKDDTDFRPVGSAHRMKTTERGAVDRVLDTELLLFRPPPDWSPWLQLFSPREDGSPSVDLIRDESSALPAFVSKREVDGDDRKSWTLDPAIASTGRVFALLERAGHAEFVSLPAPWYCLRDNRLAELDIILDVNGGDRRTSCRVADPALNGALAYVALGDWQSARSALETIADEELVDLYTSGHAPLAAAAIAYVHTATGVWPEAPWGKWLADLTERHAWLPDGPVLLARNILRSARDQSDLGRAASVLEEAYLRGIPYFSAGVEGLSSGLFALCAANPNLREKHNAVAALSARVSPRQTFTTIRIK